MAYYVRVFCTALDAPPLRDVFAFCAEQGHPLWLGEDTTDTDLDSTVWREITLRYKESGQQIATDVTRKSDGKGLLREEIAEFKEFLEDVDNGPGKRKVLQHLRATNFIVANQYLFADFDDDGYDVMSHFLNYFVQNHGGMVQCDGEGFYDSETLIVELE